VPSKSKTMSSFNGSFTYLLVPACRAIVPAVAYPFEACVDLPIASGGSAGPLFMDNRAVSAPSRH
jgi:hypothetical protein